MDLQIAYVTKRIPYAKLDLLQFMEPFTVTVWCIVLAITIIVSVSLYIVDYYSPYGWRQTSLRSKEVEGQELDFLNCIWFTIASTLLQGADNTPKAFSGKSKLFYCHKSRVLFSEVNIKPYKYSFHFLFVKFPG